MPSYDPSGYGRTLADLMRRRGEEQAALELHRGDIEANMWDRAGQSIMGAVSGWQRNVEDNRRLEMERAREARRAEVEGMQIESARMELDTKRRSAKGAETARSILPLARRENGVVGYDRELIQREMETAGYADMVPQIFERLDEQEASHYKVVEAKRDAIAGDAWRVLQGGGADDETFNAMLDLWKENDLAPKREIDAMRKAGKGEGVERALMAAVQSSPRYAELLAKARQSNAPKLQTVAPGSSVYDANNPEAGLLFTAPQEPKKPTNIEDAILQATDPAERQRLIDLKKELTAAGRQPAQAPNVQAKSFINDKGEPVEGYFDPATRRYYDASGAVVSNPKPASSRDQFTVGNLAPGYQMALGRALASVAPQKRGAITQTAQTIADNGGDIADYIRQVAVDNENVDTKNQILGRRALMASLADTRAILEEMKAKGVSTNILSGTAEDVVRKLGKTTNPELVTLKNRLQGTLINYRRAATGVAFGEREGKQYAEMFPNYKNELPVNIALIDGLEREMNTYDAEYWTHKLGKDGAELVGVMPGAPRRTGQKPPAANDGWTTVGGVRIRKKPGQ